MEKSPHISVLLDEVVSLLDVKPGSIILDGTLGFAGHSEALLRSVSGDATLIGLDRDQDALEFSRSRLSTFPNVRLFHTPYSHFSDILCRESISKVDTVLLDLGISSWQLDEPRRGFSFQDHALLDMRMDQSTGKTAADLLKTYSESQLVDLFSRYGELRFPQKLAKLICETRLSRPIETAADLTYLIKKSFFFNNQRSKMLRIFSQVFQALRIEINDELGQLTQFLDQIMGYLHPGSRMAIISFHSLEDRLVKQFITAHKNEFTRIGKAVISPTYAQSKHNTRAKSAKLRVVEKV